MSSWNAFVRCAVVRRSAAQPNGSQSWGQGPWRTHGRATAPKPPSGDRSGPFRRLRAGDLAALRQYQARTGSVTVPRGHAETLETGREDGDTAVEVKLGVRTSDTETRRNKPADHQRNQLAETGLDWRRGEAARIRTADVTAAVHLRGDTRTTASRTASPPATVVRRPAPPPSAWPYRALTPELMHRQVRVVHRRPRRRRWRRSATLARDGPRDPRVHQAVQEGAGNVNGLWGGTPARRTKSGISVTNSVRRDAHLSTGPGVRRRCSAAADVRHLRARRRRGCAARPSRTHARRPHTAIRGHSCARTPGRCHSRG